MANKKTLKKRLRRIEKRLAELGVQFRYAVYMPPGAVMTYSSGVTLSRSEKSEPAPGM